MRLHHFRQIAGVVLFAAALAAPVLAAKGADRPGAGGNQGNPGVLPPASMPYGHSYSEWTALWWQWAYSLPVAGHPLFDETGAYAGAGQSGPVWFLGGVFNVSGTATRNITVPSGKALFFPIINAEWDNECPVSDPPLSLAELEALVKSAVDTGYDIECDLDGVSITNLNRYRFTANFPITVPSGNIFDFFGCPTTPGTYSPVAGDGYYLMLRPLSEGTHHLHFHGSFAAFGNFTLDITYNITVTPAASSVTSPATARASTLGQGASPAITPSDTPVLPARRTSWGALKRQYR